MRYGLRKSCVMPNLGFIITIYPDTRSCVVRPRKHARTPVCYLREPKLRRFQPPVSRKLSSRFLRNLHILCSTYTPPSIPNLKEIALAVREIFALKSRLIFFVFFFFFAQNSKQFKVAQKRSSRASIFFKFGTHIKHEQSYNSSDFDGILSQFKRAICNFRSIFFEICCHAYRPEC